MATKKTFNIEFPNLEKKEEARKKLKLLAAMLEMYHPDALIYALDKAIGEAK